MFDYVCRMCVQEREVEQFLDFHDPVADRTIVNLADYEDSDFTDNLKQRCYYKVRINKSSALHSLWLPYEQASDQTKFGAFWRKLAAWHTDLNSVGCLMDDLESNLRHQSEGWPLVESILSLHFQER